jgi:hypothetical protein
VTALVDPAPPTIAGAPLVGAAVPFLRNPTAYLRTLRAAHGDTFVLPLLHFRLCFVFSPDGLRSLYELAEEDASFVVVVGSILPGMTVRRLPGWLGLEEPVPPAPTASVDITSELPLQNAQLTLFIAADSPAVGRSLSELPLPATRR